MPLRFRSVVPYTLPGVLALIGWWWYISRKKDRVLGHSELKRPPSSASLRTSPTEGSNGVIENGTNSPTDETARPDSPVHTTAKRLDHDISSHAQDNGDATLRVEESVGLKDETRNEMRSSDLDICESKQEVVLSTQLTKVSRLDPNISEEERPEPEGEVATACAVSPLQRVAPQIEVETPILLQDFHLNVLTSTPSLPLCAAEMQEFICEKVDQQPKEVEPDLELLAAGLITEVISAATQEVMGDASCPLLESTRICSQEIDKTEHELLSRTSSDVQNSEEGMSNGCSTDIVMDRSNCSGQTKPKVEGVSEDDLASSTPSEVSSEDLHPTDNIQVTDLSAPEEETQMEVVGLDGAERRALSEDGSVEGVCDLKRLNGMSLGNGAHGTDAETDQSGGEGSDVNSMDSVDSGCIGESNHSSSSSEVIIWEIEVPKHLVGRLIGKQGRYVSFLKQSSGAKIYISTLPYTQEFQICHIEGTQQQVDKALALIGKKFKDLDLTNLYAPPAPPLTLPSLPMTSWLLLPSGVTVEVIVVNIVSAGHVFVQQHTHPTYHALRSLDQQMFLCYSQPGTPALPSPAEVGVICAAPAGEGAWWRAQVITFYKESSEVEIRYVDYGGYDRVKIDTLRQIRSDFVTLPFQGAEVLLDNIAPLPGKIFFSSEATTALEELTRGVALLAQVSNYDNNTGLPLVHLWNMVGDEVVSVNRTLAERGLGVWVDSF
ncbi:LOW QUALITY PROTEIN: A-kinase anchor protein 1, mitochondrial-like [Periophthalmus magnuspinnatus]|uniref:LOW QUALITY PROTEIN: A-kinase anchor protein 1, mitochondrial-like n=1 Tax=Periophthalmus magnuspinnatus TaxID=409849 RepID=UPI002436BC20|nr:LOW QUALITY PROTEIN: A-kinase anchor protein 1, mitochondrial-like [Periophthalmus magnuspinnatus]